MSGQSLNLEGVKVISGLQFPSLDESSTGSPNVGKTSVQRSFSMRGELTSLDVRATNALNSPMFPSGKSPVDLEHERLAMQPVPYLRAAA